MNFEASLEDSVEKFCLIVASITGASYRAFKRFVPRIFLVYPACFRALSSLPEKGGESRMRQAFRRIERSVVAVSNRRTVSEIP